MIWYDYIQDMWGTRAIPNTTSNYMAVMRDPTGINRCYLAGYTGYIWQMDTGGSDDGLAISCSAIDRGHPLGDQSFEDQKCFSHFFMWYKPTVGVTITVSYAVDDPDGVYQQIGAIDCSHSSGQDHIHFKAVGRRLYFKIEESSIATDLIIRGWRCYYRVIGRHHAP